MGIVSLKGMGNFGGREDGALLLYLELEGYLAEWFVHEHGGEVPVRLLRGSAEWCMLEAFLQPPPADFVPAKSTDGAVAVRLPSFRSKDTRYNFWLPPRAMELLRACIRNRFDVQMWGEIHRFRNLLARRDELIYAFMEKHGISETEKNWNAIAKRYQRKRDIYRRCERRRQNSKKL